MSLPAMHHNKLVLPEHINEHGVLFGGYLLKWIDEFAYITACLRYPGNTFVTMALDNVEFRKPVYTGYILGFSVRQSRIGTTSVTFDVEVFNDRDSREGQEPLFATKVVFVNIDKIGKKKKIELPAGEDKQRS